MGLDDFVIEKKVVPILHGVRCFIVWYDSFSCSKGKKKELSFLNKKDFDFLLKK